MIGIEEIGVFFPENKVINSDVFSHINKTTLIESIGFEGTFKSDLAPEEMCVKAIENLLNKGLRKEDIKFLVVVTQETQPHIPHLSAKVHHLLKLAEDTICFDFRIGCSGFVQSLNITKSYMEKNSIDKGLIVNVETFSRYLNPLDDNSNLLLSDAASATLISNNAKWIEVDSKNYIFSQFADAITLKNNFFYMDGREVYKTVQNIVVPKIKEFLNSKNFTILDFDKILLHQASKRIVFRISELLSAEPNLIPFDLKSGNTGSCSIPILLSYELKKDTNKRILLVGFGSGFSLSFSILERIPDGNNR